jgi:hypothetical protein
LLPHLRYIFLLCGHIPITCDCEAPFSTATRIFTSRIKSNEQGTAMRARNPVAMLLAVALGLAACQTGMERPNSQAGSNSASTDRCTFDSECMSGNCEFGTCSPFKKLNGCRFDSDCSYGEECRASSCSRKVNGCNVDSDCMSGNCEFGTCSPFKKPNGCTFDSDCTSRSCVAGSCM